jgi:hypothetical protein
MSKENKVNPGQYTQAGRLTPDDTAREMKKQREMASPAKTDGKPQGFQNPKPKATEESRAAITADEHEDEADEVKDEETKN